MSKQRHILQSQTADAFRRPPSRRLVSRVGLLLLGMALLSAIAFQAQSGGHSVVSEQSLVKQFAALTEVTARGSFREYPYPRSDSEVMRPVIDRQGRVWFGSMGQNALVVFDPHTRSYRYLTPPHGRHGIMGVQVAPDGTIWFAEQVANYIGRYFPTTGLYKIYTLPWISLTDPHHADRTHSLPSAPNELAFDAGGDVWFTEFNADRLGRLDPRSGLIRQYPLSARGSVQSLFPYGISIDQRGTIWFTEAGTNRLGRIEPATGSLRHFATPVPHALLMEVTAAGQDSIWVTSFTPDLMFRFKPLSGTFTTYRAPLSGSAQSALYGLLATRSGEVWLTILEANMLARLDVSTGRFVYYHIPGPTSLPLGLAMDAGKNLWFTGIDRVGVLHLEGR